MLSYKANEMSKINYDRSLIGGLTIEAAVDFTGGVPELIDLSNLKMARERLFYIMAKADDRGAFMGCALGVSLITICVSKILKRKCTFQNSQVGFFR